MVGWWMPITSVSAAALASSHPLRDRVGYRCAASDVPDAIERLLREFNEQRAPGETSASLFRAAFNDQFVDSLPATWSERWNADISTGPVPMGVEG